MKQFTSKTQKKGEIGEEVATKYLLNKGYLIIERNYSKKKGEIDIIAMRERTFYFVEVKSFSGSFVSHETKEYSASENLTKNKFNKIRKTAIEYLSESKVSCETFEFKLIVVKLDFLKKLGRIVLFENL